MKNALIVTIENEEYYFIKAYKDNTKYRQSLNKLVRATYDFDFEEWYQQGYWSDKYRPYSLVHNEEVVANISVSTIDFLIEGKLYHTVQIGTVMTAEAYRKKGLSKVLMNKVLEEYENSYDLIYLYANDSVLEFYPKFGFTQAEEYNYTKNLIQGEKKYSYRKLDRKELSDRAILLRIVTNNNLSSRIAMVGNPGLDMFYLISFMSENIYYIEELDLLAVAENDGDNMFLLDVFCEQEFNMDEVIHSLMNNGTKKVTLGFTPFDDTSYTCELLKEEGTTFFIKGNNINNRGRFPILSHA
jgi:GNAT superfamily N-acetyltransferase